MSAIKADITLSRCHVLSWLKTKNPKCALFSLQAREYKSAMLRYKGRTIHAGLVSQIELNAAALHMDCKATNPDSIGNPLSQPLLTKLGAS
jgi:hypothetical protein